MEKEKSRMVKSVEESLNFSILDSMFVDVEKSILNESEITLEIEHSTTRSAYVKLWKGNLNGDTLHISFNFETNNKIDTEKTEAYIKVKCLESLDTPEIHPIDFSQKTMSFSVTPTTTWENTEISLYFTHIFPPLKDTHRTFSMRNINIKRNQSLTFCSHTFGNVNLEAESSFKSKDLDDVLLIPGNYVLQCDFERSEDIYKLGVVFTSKKNIGYTVSIPLLLEQSVEFEILKSEHFTVNLYALSEKQTKVSLSRLSIYTNKEDYTAQDRPKMCVVIPSFNCAEYIERSVSSLLNQTFVPHAIYVIDDKSSDNTQSVVKNLKTRSQEKDVLLESIRLEANSGPYVAKNMVIYNQLNNFDYFALQDADDYSENTRLEKQLDSILKKPQLVSYTFMQRMCGDKLIKNRGLDARRSYATGLFKKDYFRKVGFFEAAKFGADDEMFNRACLTQSKNHAIVLNEVLYFAEYREGSLTNGQEKVSVEKSSDFLSGLRKEYAQSFGKRYINKSRNDSYKTNPFYTHTTTPKELTSFSQITLNMASYPPRFESLTKVLKSIYGFVEDVGGVLNVCLNNVDSVPSMMKNFESLKSINFFFPDSDVKDNGKFINVRQGINLWLDDDIEYTPSYFIHMMYKLITTPPNTAICVHGSNDGSAYSIDRRVRHFRAYYPNTIDCEIAGTGTLVMLITEPFILKRLKEIATHKVTGMVDLLFALECHKLGVKILNVDKHFSLQPMEQPQESTNLFSENKGRKEQMDSYITTIRGLKSL